MALITAVTSLFAMNAYLNPEWTDENGNNRLPFAGFLIVSIGTAFASIVLFVAVIGYARWKRII
jgi:hypothetical protein